MRPYFHFVALIHRCVHRFPNPANTISNVQFNQQGTRLLCREKNQLPFVYNFSNGQEVGGDQNRTRIMKFSSLGYAIPNCGINLSCFAGQNDELVVAASADHGLFVWPIDQKVVDEQVVDQPLVVLRGHKGSIFSLRYNRRIDTLASAGKENIIKL